MEQNTNTNTNYMDIIPNSQSFDKLEQIIMNLEYGLMTSEEIIVGIQNSINMGYQMKKVKKKKKRK